MSRRPGLKQIIKKKEIIKQNAGCPLDLNGEPLIFSVKYTLGERKLPVSFFRNKKFRSLLKCWFPEYLKNQPVVLIVCFYVSPFRDRVDLTPAQLRAENVPAIVSWELCDVLLSFLEMLRYVLFRSYRQIAKIDCVKFYSNNPRTTFQYLSWENYVQLSNHNPLDAKAESVGKISREKGLQSKRKRDEQVKPASEGEPATGP